MILNNNFTLRNIETFNIYDFRILVNGERQKLENEIKIEEDDELLIKVSKKDVLQPSQIIIIGFDPTVTYDSNFDPESSLDEDKDEYKNY